VVSKEEFEQWVISAKTKFANNISNNSPLKLANSTNNK
jgi:hypothetical protein